MRLLYVYFNLSVKYFKIFDKIVETDTFFIYGFWILFHGLIIVAELLHTNTFGYSDESEGPPREM